MTVYHNIEFYTVVSFSSGRRNYAVPQGAPPFAMRLPHLGFHVEANDITPGVRLAHLKQGEAPPVMPVSGPIQQ
jgi:hypothetical protein